MAVCAGGLDGAEIEVHSQIKSRGPGAGAKELWSQVLQ